MNTSVAGRVGNMTLSAANCLNPVVEAVINAIHAIQFTARPEGEVWVEVYRDVTQKTLDGDETGCPVDSFSVRDNGVGFDEDNYRSFDTSDSTFKRALGGKGVGRFLWLKAFDLVAIESNFQSATGPKCRRFRFSLPDGITDHELESSADVTNCTIVRLRGFHRQFAERCPRGIATIARRILEHCLEYFLAEGCPRVFIFERDNTPILLNDLLHAVILDKQETALQVKGHDLQVTHLLVVPAAESKHRMNYCAHGCIVRTEAIGNKLPDLVSRIADDKGRPGVYAGYVSGELLDQVVSSDRASFGLTQESQEETLFPDDITWPNLAEAAIQHAGGYLKPHTDPIKKNKRARIEQYIYAYAPQYRYLSRDGATELDRIPPDTTDDKLPIELFKIHQTRVLQARQEAAKVLSPGHDIPNEEEFRSIYDRLLPLVNETSKAELAQYIVQRRAFLALLQKALSRQADGRCAREVYVHKIIFPMRVTSDEINYEDHNLWIIDERLAYHYYLASDRPAHSLEPLSGVESTKRCDLVVFNTPSAFVSDQVPYGSVVIIEFKRPLREDYSPSEDPIAQVYEYVRLIRDGKALNKDGRPLSIQDSTPFYCYVIADLTQALRRFAENAGLIRAPDGLGYYGWNSSDSVRAYVEVVSFDKMLNDAQKRNRMLFEKLELPS